MTTKDSDNLSRLEQLRPRYEKLRDLKIRADADVERFDADFVKAKENAIKVAGTDDENAIREQIKASYEANTKDVNEFEALLNDIESKVNSIGVAG